MYKTCMSSPYNVRLPIYWWEIYIFPVILVKYIYRCNYGQISHYKMVLYIIKWCIYGQIIFIKWCIYGQIIMYITIL